MKARNNTHVFIHRTPTGNTITTRVTIRGRNLNNWKIQTEWKRKPSLWDSIEFKRAVAIVEGYLLELTGEDIALTTETQ